MSFDIVPEFTLQPPATTPPNLPVIHADLSDRVVLIVGTNVGLGLEAAKHFAQMNPKKLFVTSRTEEKCAQTAQVLQQETGCESVVSWPLELSDFASVKAFADRFQREGGGQLDILVLNAGMISLEYNVTADGHEETIQVNHLSGALLALRLLPILLSTAQNNKTVSRVVVVSSLVHRSVDFGPARIPSDAKLLETLSRRIDNYTEDVMIVRYRDSKLLNVLFARALQAHLPDSAPVIVTLVDPGFTISSLLRTADVGQFTEWAKIARTTEEGSRQLILAAVGPRDGGDVEQMRGGYVANNEVVEPSEWVLSSEGKQMQGKTWNETMEVLSNVDARVEGCIASTGLFRKSQL
ncbi:hypothetical protein EUX98_g9365 [Antrodiella citrinella]|uniref:Ketoreductase (KR) domain-containing protein n=1 Tax=Antrodiella citrinella TaxID=2447956 RepID=A0A4S4LUB0_9APHY|nr:hypothetical protein EUX98_g9365 [Antrodiella citrinella]